MDLPLGANPGWSRTTRREGLLAPRYGVYIQSDAWRDFRDRYRAARPWECVCGQTTGLHLHHISYERLGAEEFDDVHPLCPTCHARLHAQTPGRAAGLDPSEWAHRLRADRVLDPRGDRVSIAYEEQLARRAEDLRPQMARLRQALRAAKPLDVRIREARAHARHMGVDIHQPLRLIRLAFEGGRSRAAIERRVQALEDLLWPA